MAKHAVKYKTIVGTLSDEIMAGRYRQPMSFPSVARIVRRFGVAYQTAVKVLDELKQRGLVRIREPAAPVPSVPAKIKIRLTENSRLRLDFDGQITLGPVVYGGRAYVGVIDASTHPEFISGRGSINAMTGGTILLFR